MTAYYNEHDHFAAAWLRELIKAGHIAPGIVDERSIEDVLPIELAGFTQCHFFAGIGVWSYALRRAGWPDDRPVWTGSCPCQPFSAAGKGDGFTDERHLWPALHHLIAQCKPPVVFGEQVASKAVDAWIDLVHADLEAVGYAFGSVPFPSAGVGAPHIRDRNFWVADDASKRRGEARASGGRPAQWVSNCGKSGWVGSNNPGLEGLRGGHQTEGGRFGEVRPVTEAGEYCRVEYSTGDGRESRGPKSGGRGAAGGCGGSGLADSDGMRRSPVLGQGAGRLDCGKNDERAFAGFGPEQQAVRMDNANNARLEGLGGGHQTDAEHYGQCRPESSQAEPHRHRQNVWISDGGYSASEGQPTTCPVNGFWQDADWLFCRDGKWRPVEPGAFPLVNGAAARVGRLRGYGNAINAEAAKTFIESFLAI